MRIFIAAAIHAMMALCDTAHLRAVADSPGEKVEPGNDSYESKIQGKRDKDHRKRYLAGKID